LIVRRLLALSFIVGLTSATLSASPSAAHAEDVCKTPAGAVCYACKVEDAPDVYANPPWQYSVDLRTEILCFDRDIVIG
jgi:hypothetical protein